MKKFTLEEVNNMDAETMRQVLRTAVIERQMQERAEAERIAVEEGAKAEEAARMDAFFAQRFQNSRPKFGDQY